MCKRLSSAMCKGQYEEQCRKTVRSAMCKRRYIVQCVKDFTKFNVQKTTVNSAMNCQSMSRIRSSANIGTIILFSRVS